MSQNNQPSLLNKCKSLCFILFRAVPTILLDGIIMKPAKMLFEFLIEAFFITVNLSANLLQCLLVLALAGVKLVLDLIGELVCGLFNTHYGAWHWTGLSTTLMLSGNECLASIVMAVVLPLTIIFQLTTQVFGTIGSTCHAMYVWGRLIWEMGAQVFSTFLAPSDARSADGLRVSGSDQKPELSNACRKNASAAVWDDKQLNRMKDKGIGTTKRQGLSNKSTEDKEIRLGYRKTPFMDVRWLYTGAKLQA